MGSVGAFFGDVASCYGELSTSLAVEAATPLKKLAQNCSKLTKVCCSNTLTTLSY